MKKYSELSIHQKINIKAKLPITLNFDYRIETIFKNQNVMVSDAQYRNVCEPNYRAIQTPKHQAVQEKIVLHTVKRMNKNRRKKLAIYRKLEEQMFISFLHLFIMSALIVLISRS